MDNLNDYDDLDLDELHGYNLAYQTFRRAMARRNDPEKFKTVPFSSYRERFLYNRPYDSLKYKPLYIV